MTPRKVALTWAALTVVVSAATAPAVGISRDEGVYLAAAESYAAWWGSALARPGRALATIDARFQLNHEHPPLAKELYGLTHAVLAEGLGWTGHLQGARFGAFLLAGLLSCLLATAGHALAGMGGALLAPALFWLVPRHFHHAHPALLDMPVTALSLATVWAYRQSLPAPVRGHGHPGAEPLPAKGQGSKRWAVACGLLFGAAVSVKHNAWFLPPLLLAHWLATHLPALLRAGRPERRRAFPLAFVAMAILGPAVLLATWPWLWHDLAARLREYAFFHLRHEHYPWHYLGRLLRKPPFPIEYPFVVTALTVPAASLSAMAGGLVHAAGRLAGALRGRAEGVSVSDEALLLLAALFPMALIAWPTVPHFGGVKHWLPAMPFLALLGARALVAAGRALWPAHPGRVTAALALLALAPALRAVAHVYPFGTAAYNELAGGAGGAATLGMQRQFWGDSMVAVLRQLDEHAAPGARVWYQEATWLAVKAYQRDGRLRSDLAWADGPEGADISVYHHHREFRDKEFLTWTRFRTARPVAGAYLDEVPLVTVYARPGAWR